MNQVHVTYSGTVQGVGFRYTVRHLAVKEGCYGWVRNLPDGSVELLAQGEQDAVDRLLRQIDGNFEGYITGRAIDRALAQNVSTDFRIIM